MWDLARARLRALLHFPWPGRNFTIGSVFTSEQAVVMLERIHVFKPEWVFGLNDRDVEWAAAPRRTSALPACSRGSTARWRSAARRPDGVGRPGGGARDRRVLPVAVEHFGGSAFNLVLRPPAGPAGEVRVTVTADDLRQRTTREVVVSVSAAGDPPTGPPGAYTRPEPIGLSPLRGSFELDEDGLFQAPPG